VPTRIFVARVLFCIRFREAGQNSEVDPLVTYFTVELVQTVTPVLSTLDICQHIAPELAGKLPLHYIQVGV
jgi:hypothetical protein